MDSLIKWKKWKFARPSGRFNVNQMPLLMMCISCNLYMHGSSISLVKNQLWSYVVLSFLVTINLRRALLFFQVPFIILSNCIVKFILRKNILGFHFIITQSLCSTGKKMFKKIQLIIIIIVIIIIIIQTRKILHNTKITIDTIDHYRSV